MSPNHHADAIPNADLHHPDVYPTQRPSPTLRATIEPTQPPSLPERCGGSGALLDHARRRRPANATPDGGRPRSPSPSSGGVNAQIASTRHRTGSWTCGGINVELTALGGQAFITGNVFVAIEVTGSFATISIGDITVNAPEPPEAYIETVTGDFFTLMVSVLDTILTQRLGEESNLENIVLTDDAMEISLLVPEQ
jgi:hypothetical protein